MKKLMLIFALLLTYCYTFSQVQPPECSEPGGDTEAPQYTLPYYLADSIYPNFESVPPLWNDAGTAVSDLAFETMTDNCMMVYWPPCWCSATMASGYLDQTDTSVTYTFTAYDVSGNSNSQDITFYWDNRPFETVEPDNLVLPSWTNNAQPRPQNITTFSDGKKYEYTQGKPKRIDFISDGYKVQYTIYPNPSDGNFKITPENFYEILNMRGEKQNPDYLEDGIYLIRVDGAILRNKLIIKR